MQQLTSAALALSLVVLVGGCAPPPSGAGQASQGLPSKPVRTLVVAVANEPTVIAVKGAGGTGASGLGGFAPFHASLSDRRESGTLRPELAEALPQVNTDSWRVFPDGRMDTTLKLRPNLTWHDGVPLTPNDFIFMHQVLLHPTIGKRFFGPLPQTQIDRIDVIDERTMVFRWNALTQEAERSDIPPLPRHILGALFEAGDPDAFMATAFWTRDFVGLGAYRIANWEAGAFIEAEAFSRYALGAPHIQRIKIVFNTDPNTAVASLLAGSVDLSHALRFEGATVVAREWTKTNQGTVDMNPSSVEYFQVQFRPDYLNPIALRDARVRKALVHSLNRDALNDGMFEGFAVIAQALTSPQIDYYSQIEKAITKYPYDPRRVEQLLGEAGIVKGSDSSYRSSSGDRFEFEIRGIEEKELVILAGLWKQAGLEVRPLFIPPQLATAEQRTIFPALGRNRSNPVEASLFGKFEGSAVAMRETAYSGVNKGGYVSSEYDRLFKSFLDTLDRATQIGWMVSMEKLLSEEVPVIPLYFGIDPVAHISDLAGPTGYAGGGSLTWNLHDWDWR